MKNYYQLLEIAPSASADEVKRAFRLQIARYHPDKVQHLGKEFQDMAAGRAAELTEAYRILSHEGSRADYDGLLRSLGTEAAPADTRPPAPDEWTTEAPPPTASDPAPASTQAFSEERGRRDEFVRQAAVGRLQHAIEAALGDGFERPQVRGFDFAVVPKPKLFARSRPARLLVRFVSTVDAAAIGDAWVAAAKWAAADHDEVCVLLIGTTIAPTGELASAIGDQRRKTRGVKVSLVPVDARDWAAHIPTDAPPLARTLLEGLQKLR